MVSVLTAGHVNWDVILRVDRLPEPDGEASIRSQCQSGGGSAANVAAALAGLDVDAALVGSVGDDDNGLLARRELEHAGVDLDGLVEVTAAETAVKYLLVDDHGQVSVLGNDGVNEALTPADVDTVAVTDADHVHLTSQRPETAAAIARTASEAGVPVSFDPGRRVGDRDFGTTVERADILFATDHEVEAALDATYDETTLARRVVVVTSGADGAVVHAGDDTHHHPGFDVESVDATGAGDAFAAGFIATVRRGGDLDRALEYANACGALTASREGARSAPRGDDVDRFLSSRR